MVSTGSPADSNETTHLHHPKPDVPGYKTTLIYLEVPQ